MKICQRYIVVWGEFCRILNIFFVISIQIFIDKAGCSKLGMLISIFVYSINLIRNNQYSGFVP